MTETFIFGKNYAEDLAQGYGTAPVTLADGSVQTLNKVGIQTFLKSAYLSAADFAGADAGAQINAAVAALPATGGTVDARGLYGTQVFSTTVTVDRPVNLLLNVDTSFTGTASPFFNVTSSGALTIEGCGKGLTNITITNLNATFIQAATQNPINIRYLYLISAGQLSGAFISLTGPGGSTANNHSTIELCHFTGAYIAIDMGIVDANRIINNQFDLTQYRAIRSNNTANADQGDNYIFGNVFASDTSKSDTAAIEHISGGIAKIQSNKFFQHKYAYFMNWGSNGSTGQLLIQNNRFEAMTTAVLSFQKQNGITGGVGGILITDNWMRADVGGSNNGNLINIPTPPSGAEVVSLIVIAGNFLRPGDAATAINVGNSASGGVLIDDNLIYGAGGTSKGIVIGTGNTECHIGLGNIVLCATNFTINSTLRGGYSPDNFAIGIDPSVTLTNPLNLANNAYLAGYVSGNTFKRLIALNATPNVSIDPDNVGTVFGGFIKPGVPLVGPGVDTISVDTTAGLLLKGGGGTTYDAALVNKNGDTVVLNPTGTTTFQFAGMALLQNVAFASLVLATNGQMVYCSDCKGTADGHTAGAGCSGAGTGAVAVRVAGANLCY
jgi:hypothetical protein